MYPCLILITEYVGLTASHPQSYHYYMDDMLFNNILILIERTFIFQMEMPMI